MIIYLKLILFYNVILYYNIIFKINIILYFIYFVFFCRYSWRWELGSADEAAQKGKWRRDGGAEDWRHTVDGGTSVVGAEAWEGRAGVGRWQEGGVRGKCWKVRRRHTR